MTTLNVFACSFLLLLCVNGCMCLEEWCVAKKDTKDDVARGYLYTACCDTDCSAIRTGGDCFEPDNLISHASYILNLKYKKATHPTCPKYIGALTTTDPSYGKCKYQ